MRVLYVLGFCCGCALVTVGAWQLVLESSVTVLGQQWERRSLAAGFMEKCPGSANNECPECGPCQECHLMGGGTGACECQGDNNTQPGCSTPVPRKRCVWALYFWCNNNKNTCGTSLQPTCTPVLKDGFVIDCNNAGCTPGGQVDCNGC